MILLKSLVIIQIILLWQNTQTHMRRILFI